MKLKMKITFCSIDRSYAKCEYMADMDYCQICTGNNEISSCGHQDTKEYMSMKENKEPKKPEISPSSTLLDELEKEPEGDLHVKHYGMIVNSDSHIHTGLTVKIVGEGKYVYILEEGEFCSGMQKDAIAIINKETFDFLQDRSNKIREFIDENNKGQS